MRESEKKMQCLFDAIGEMGSFQDMLEALGKAGVCSAAGADDSQQASLLAAASLRSGRTMLLVQPNELAAQRMAEDINALLGGGAAFLPARDISFLKVAASSRELSMRRIEVLGACLAGEARILTLSADALLNRLMPAERFRENVLYIDENLRMQPEGLMEKLVAAGYERVELVEARGQCAMRGGIVDVYPIGSPNALRIEFFDDEIDSVRSFDVMTQRSISKRENTRLYPASEVLLVGEENLKAAQALEYFLRSAQKPVRQENHQKEIEQRYGLMPIDDFLKLTQEEEGDEKPSATLAFAKPNAQWNKNFSKALAALEAGHTFDGADALIPVLMGYKDTVLEYLNDPVIVLNQPERIRERCENCALEFSEQFTAAVEREEALPQQGKLLFSYDEILARMNRRSILIMRMFQRSESDFTPTALVNFEIHSAAAYQSNIKELARDVALWKEQKYRVALMAGGVARGERLEKALSEQNVSAKFSEESPENLQEGQAIILPQTINHGFVIAEIRLAVISESDIFGVNRQSSRSKYKSGEKLAAFTDLKVGDYVVHENHGIGQYMGTVRLCSEGTYRDYLHIRYQGTDKLYVPTDQLDRVQKYIGSEGEAPKLNRLSGGEWQRQKAKVRESVQKIAGELVKLYAHRESASGYAFPEDTPWQREFEDRFPYEETPDQLAAIEDIKRDMEKPRIMDRLLCGDVGYGKTEVALRAIFKCVMGGKQAALLAPTTILVQQHYATMRNRFDGFPIHMETMSRFKSPAEQKQVIRALKEGSLDVVIGTHRLLAKDVDFKQLGLLVVDEEQRFGVAHKEAIKQLKKNVDVLTLTATPIPRTLHMSMVGIRDMSLLQSPPEERYPVQTYVVEYSDSLVRDAILREISRNGQVYVLYNRVQTIEVMYQRLKKLVPEARIAVGHGQMREHALEDVMLDFYEGKFDVLLCTTIIEAGLDVPRANTMIVCDADRFGLSQLYQLRGRVGRSNRLAYAYLTVSPKKILTETADKRLAAIREFTEFGSGFRVAMRDLEIRGAGNLLGSEQSGFMASVGYDLYVKMIDESVRALRGDVSQGDIQTRMDVKADAYLPQNYIGNDLMRVEIYKKIASVRSRENREDLIEELIDRFGDPMRPVMNLIEIAHLKNLCSELAIDLVTDKGGKLNMRFSLAADIDLMSVLKAVRAFPDCIRVLGGNPPSMEYFQRDASTEDLLKGAVKVMEKIISLYLEYRKEDAQ